MGSTARLELSIVAAVTAVTTATACAVLGASVAAGVVLATFFIPACLLAYAALRPVTVRHLVIPWQARRGVRRLEHWLAQQQHTRTE